MASKSSIAGMIYEYIVQGISLEQIGASRGMTTSEISSLLRPYGITGAINGNGAWASGKNRGKYRDSGVELRSGEEIDITLNIIQEWVNNRRSHESLEAYLNRSRTHLAIQPKHVAVAV